MTEQGSPNQEERDKVTEGSFENQTPNTKPTKTYSPEERRLAELFFDTIEPYEKLKYSDSNREAPLDLGERLLNAFETFNESFRLFLNEIGYYEKEVIYKLVLRLLADKINSINNGDIGTAFKRPYKAYFEYYYGQLEKMKPDVKFNLSWTNHNKYLLPMIVEALCEIKAIPEPKRTALDAFQFIFPKEKLQQLNVESSIKSAFLADDSSVFILSLNNLLTEIKFNLIDRQEKYRKVQKSNKNKK